MDAVERAFDRAVRDRRHGAAAIEQRLLGELLELRSDWTAAALGRGARRLLEGQPAMANLRRVAHLVDGGDLDRVADELRRRAATLDELAERLAEAAWPAVDGAGRVLTLSRSSAVASVLDGARQRGWAGEIVVFDGSPAGGGADQAEVLADSGEAVRSQPDAAMAVELDAPGNRVVVGADAVGTRRFVNVCGTRVLAELAHARGVPVIVVADSGKDLPEDELDEVLAALPSAGDGRLGRSWPLFEAVALELVTERVAE